MACRLDGAKPLSEPMLGYFNWTPRNKLPWNFNQNSFKNIHLKMSSGKWRPLSRPHCVNFLRSAYLFLHCHDFSRAGHNTAGRHTPDPRGSHWHPATADHRWKHIRETIVKFTYNSHKSWDNSCFPSHLQSPLKTKQRKLLSNLRIILVSLCYSSCFQF